MKNRVLLWLLLLFSVVGANAQETLTVYDGGVDSFNEYVPVYGWYCDASQQCQYVIPAADLQEMAGATISSMTFYLSTPASGAWGNTFNVYLNEVDFTTFPSTSFQSISDASPVYQGVLDGQGSTMVVNFTAPYTYNGGNLLVDFESTGGGAYISAFFYGSEVSGACLEGYDDWGDFVITQQNFIPKTTFEYSFSSCSAPTNLVASNITGNGADLSWTAGGSEAEWQIMINDDEENLISVNYASYTLTGLSSSTGYNVKVRSVCGTDNVSLWTSVSFSTPCGVYSLPYSEDFESYTSTSYNTAGVLPYCWDVIFTGTSTGCSPHVSTAQAPNSKGIVMTSGSSNYGSNNYVILPLFEKEASEVNFSFSYKMESASYGTLYLGYITDASSADSFVSLRTITSSKSATTLSVDMSQYDIPAGARIAFKWYYSSSYWSVGIDNIFVRELSAENDILSFSVPTMVGDAVIDAENHTVNATITFTSPWTLTPTIEVSEDATISPASGVETNFEGGATYTVTAENGDAQEWNVSFVRTEPLSDANITAFSFSGIMGEAVIDSENAIVTAIANWNVDITTLVPQITLSPSATMTYDGVSAIDFTNAFAVTVTAEDGTNKEWTISVENDPTACPDITLGNVNVTATTAELTINKVYREPSYSYVLSINSLNAADLESAEATVVEVEGATTTIFIEGLQPITSYYLYVKPNCSDGIWKMKTFTTECAVYSVPFEEGFESTTYPPQCWSIYTGLASSVFAGSALYSTSYGWYRNTISNGLPGNHVKGNIYGTSFNYWLVTPSIAIENNNVLTFDIALTAYNNANPAATTGTDDKFMVIVSTDNGQTWLEENAIVWDNAGSERVYNNIATNGENVQINLSAYAGQTVKIAFYGESTTYNADNDLHIDNIIVRMASTENDILSFSVPTMVGDAVVDAENHSVNATITYSSPWTLAPTIQVSDYATVSPSSGVETNFEGGATFTVTAEDGSTQDWTVTLVKAEPLTGNDITAFSFSGIMGEAVIDSENATVTATANWYVDITTLVPQITLSQAATMSYDGISAIDFTNDFAVTVTAEDGNLKTWTISVENDPTACPDITLGNVNVTATTAELTINKVYREPSYSYVLSSNSLNAADLESAEATVVEVEGATTTIFIEDLQPNTSYYLYVKQNCSDGNWQIATFHTPCFAYELPYTEDFEGTTRDCWTLISNNTANQGYLGFNTDQNHTQGGSTVLRMSSYSSASDYTQYAISPELTIENAAAVSLYYKRYTSGSETFKFGYSSTGTNDADFEWSGNVSATTSWQEYTATVPAGTKYIAIKYISDYAYYLYIDDITVREISAENDIVSFSAPNMVGDAVIDAENHTVNATVSFTTDLASLVPTIEVSEYATLTGIASGIAADFTTPVVCTVTSETGVAQEWTITVVNAPVSHDAEITELTFATIDGVATIDSENATVSAYAQWDADITIIVPQITVSPSATITFDDEAWPPVYALNFENDKTFSVTAEDGTTTKVWTIHIERNPYACPDAVVTNIETTENSAVATVSKVYLETSYYYVVSETAMSDEELDNAEANVVYVEGFTTNINIENLQAATTYFLYVKANCTDGNWVENIFETNCPAAAIELPFFEGFEGASRNCWTLISNNTDNSVSYGIADGYYHDSRSGDYGLTFSSYSSANDYTQYAISPELNVENAAKLNFFYKVNEDDAEYTEEVFMVGYSTTGTNDSDFTWGETITTSNPVWQEYYGDVPAGTKYIAIKCISNWQYFLHIDDITVREASAENDIVSFSVPNMIADAVIDAENHTVNATVAHGTDLTALVPAIEVSEYATLAGIVSGIATDFTAPVVCTVTSESGVAQEWTITVDEVAAYTIIATAGENGTITPEGEVEVIEGEDQSFTIAANAHYHIASVMVDNNDVTSSLENGTYTFQNITANHSIDATFALDQHTITVLANDNSWGIVTGGGTYNYGEQVTITATANPNFEFAGWADGDQNATRTITVEGDATYTANFSPVSIIPTTYYIVATAGEGGQISPSGVVAVDEHQNLTFTITPNANYQVASVLVDGEAAELTDGVYTFVNVMADHTIAVEFEEIPATVYTITATAGENGTITPEGEVEVIEGADQSFTIAANEGYEVSVVLVDGEEVELTDGVYTFVNVMADHTIDVTFAPVSSIETANAGAISTYPNPNNGMFSIDFSNIEGSAVYQLVDVKGAMVDTREISIMEGNTINFDYNLRPGTYFVRIIANDNVYVEQIVVE